MGREGKLLIRAQDSHEAIDVIDELRTRGLHAGLADVPGRWDVAVTASLSEVVPVLASMHAARRPGGNVRVPVRQAKRTPALTAR